MQPVEGAGRARAAMGVHVVYAVAGARGYSRVAQSPQLLSLLGRQGNGSRVAGDEKRNWMSCLPPTSAPGGMESRILAVHQDSNGQGRLGGLEIDHELVRFVAWVGSSWTSECRPSPHTHASSPSHSAFDQPAARCGRAMEVPRFDAARYRHERQIDEDAGLALDEMDSLAGRTQ